MQSERSRMCVHVMHAGMIRYAPSCGLLSNVSMHTLASHSMTHVITAPDLTNIGAFLLLFPVFLSIDAVSFEIVHSSATACTCNTAV